MRRSEIFALAICTVEYIYIFVCSTVSLVSVKYLLEFLSTVDSIFLHSNFLYGNRFES